MKARLNAEMLKLRSTRATVLLLLATFAFVCLTMAVSVPTAGDLSAPVALDDPSLLAVTVGGAFGVPMVLMVLLGGVAYTQEFRYGTVTSTYLVEPRRTRVLVAKWLSLVLVSVLVTTVTVVVAVAFGLALIASRHGDATLGMRFWQMVAGGFVVMAVYGIIGVAIGGLVRNQITVVTGVLVWMLLVEHIVVPSYPVVGRWMPLAATFSLMQLGPEVDPDGKLLSTGASGFLLAAYAATAVILALRITPRRDIL